MKQHILLLSALLVAFFGGQNVSAQSTYTWNASQWGVKTGSLTINDNTIEFTSFDWDCVQVKNTAQFKLPLRQTFIVVKGTNLVVNDNNPNIFDLNGETDLNGESYQQSFKGATFTVNDSGTLMYADITSILPTETDFYGNVDITSVGLTLTASEGNLPTVSSIDFVAADILDAATDLIPADATDVTCEPADGEFKKTLTFTSGKESNDMGIAFSLDQKLNSSDMFLVIESDNNTLNTNSRIKLRNLKVGGSGYENNNGGCYVAGKEVSPGHYLYIHSFYKGSETSANLLAQWEENQTMNAKSGTLYINNKDQNGKTIKIYRLGFYNLSEIMQLYGLTGEKWWFTTANEGKLDVEIHSAATQNVIRINGNYGTANTNTTAYAAQLLRSMGKLPSNFTEIILDSKFSFKTDEQPCLVDVFADMPATVTKITLDQHEIIYLPTANPTVSYKGNKYYAFKEEEDNVTIPTVVGDTGGNWSSLTRTFRAGYNSLCVPFNNLQIESLPAGLSVYQLSGYNDGVVTFSRVTSNVSSNDKMWPYIVYAETEGTYVLLGRDAVTESLPSYNYKSVGDARFVGSFVNEVPTGEYAARTNYGIDKDGKLARMGASTKTTYYRAFLSLPAGAKARAAVFDDEPTGIKSIITTHFEGEDAVYDLQGHQVAQPTKGLYIVNGKKVVIK